jgi:hypothetical protein
VGYWKEVKKFVMIGVNGQRMFYNFYISETKGEDYVSWSLEGQILGWVGWLATWKAYQDPPSRKIPNPMPFSTSQLPSIRRN